MWCHLVIACARADGQRVADLDPARRCLPRRRQDVGSRLVCPRCRVVDPERSQPEVARLTVEQRPEDTGRVEPRDAEPADRAVGRHQCPGVAVGEERKVSDRWERGRRCCALCRRSSHRGPPALAPPHTLPRWRSHDLTRAGRVVGRCAQLPGLGGAFRDGMCRLARIRARQSVCHRRHRPIERDDRCASSTRLRPKERPCRRTHPLRTR